MSAPADSAWLTAERAAYLQGGVSISVASRDAALRPSLAKGLGCRVLAGGELRLYVDARQSEALLRDVRACGQLAVVFSEIASHRALQLKAGDARVVDLDAEDQRRVDAHAAAYGAAILALGYPADMVAAFLAHRVEDRRAISCHPGDAFQQTPGPQAGSRIEAGG